MTKSVISLLLLLLYTPLSAAQALGFKEREESKLNLTTSIIYNELKISDVVPSAESSTLPQIGIRYAMLLRRSARLHGSVDLALGSSQIITAEEDLLFKLNNSRILTLSGGIGGYFIGFKPINSDIPGFRNLGGLLLVLQVESQKYGGVIKSGILSNSQGLAKIDSLVVYGRLSEYFKKDQFHLFAEVSKISYDSQDSGLTYNFLYAKLGIAFEFR